MSIEQDLATVRIETRKNKAFIVHLEGFDELLETLDRIARALEVLAKLRSKSCVI